MILPTNFSNLIGWAKEIELFSILFIYYLELVFYRMKQPITYFETLKALKSQILSSRYRAALLINQEASALYFAVGKTISEKVKIEKWGSHVLENLSNDLQGELPGLKGFSSTNLKRMRLFYEEWSMYFEQNSDNQMVSIRPSITDELKKVFLSISFTHHYELLIKTQNLEQRLFYIQKVRQKYWSVEVLKHHLKTNLLHG